MTAEMAGRTAIEGVWGTLKRLREQWLLVLFLAGAVLWVRDTYEEFAKLPPMVRQQMSGLAEVQATVTRLEGEVTRRLTGDRSPVLDFPGTAHGVADAVRGGWTTLYLRPVRRLRDDCTARGIEAWMIDRQGQWYSVETAVKSLPEFTGETDLAFGVRVDPSLAAGRTRLLLQVVFDCGTHRQVEAAPLLQFRVTGD